MRIYSLLRELLSPHSLFISSALLLIVDSVFSSNESDHVTQRFPVCASVRWPEGTAGSVPVWEDAGVSVIAHKAASQKLHLENVFLFVSASLT